MRCLEKRPADRPLSGEAIVAALAVADTRRHSGGGPVIEKIANAPLWVPWAVAGVTTLTAIVLAVLYATR